MPAEYDAAKLERLRADLTVAMATREGLTARYRDLADDVRDARAGFERGRELRRLKQERGMQLEDYLTIEPDSDLAWSLKQAVQEVRNILDLTKRRDALQAQIDAVSPRIGPLNALIKACEKYAENLEALA